MCCEQLIATVQNGKDCVDYLAALLTPAIAFLAILIAVLQWRTNANRLKHELFDRRYKQFEVVRDFIGSILATGKSSPVEQNKFIFGTMGMRFIFDTELANYRNETINHLALELERLDSELEGLTERSPREERANKIQQKRDIRNKLTQELKGLEDRFSKYLQL